MTNATVSKIFGQMADILEILGEDRFRVNSYRKSARILAELPSEADQLLRDGTLSKTPGVGKATVKKIEEYLDRGRIEAHQELLGKIPISLLDLLSVQGMGPKGVKNAYDQLRVTSIPELKAAIEDGSLATLSGFGPKKCDGLRKAILFLEKASGRMRLDQARGVADQVMTFLEQQAPVQRLEVAGSLRRWVETIGDVSILATPQDDVTPQAIIDTFTQADFVVDCLAAGPTHGSVLVHHSGTPIQVDLRVVEASSFGAAWQYFTGSKDHTMRLRDIASSKGMKLNEYGLYRTADASEPVFVTGQSEEAIYQGLGLDPVDPKLRQDRGEVEAAQAHTLPRLVTLEDIRGDLHMHTTASDGRCELEEMVTFGIERGYEYLCITDHSASSVIANGLSAERLIRQIKAIRRLNEGYPEISVLAGSEVDILSDGRLDYEDGLLAELDFVVASVHAGMNNPRDKGTARLLKAMDNPSVTCIGHPTTRMLGRREAMDLDMIAILRHAADTHTAMEVNSNPMRLDLNDLHCRMAIDHGVKLIINTDAHNKMGLDRLEYGVATAAKGWATKEDVLNTLPWEKLKERLQMKQSLHS